MRVTDGRTDRRYFPCVGCCVECLVKLTYVSRLAVNSAAFPLSQPDHRRRRQSWCVLLLFTLLCWQYSWADRFVSATSRSQGGTKQTDEATACLAISMHRQSSYYHLLLPFQEVISLLYCNLSRYTHFWLSLVYVTICFNDYCSYTKHCIMICMAC